jgi:hypothetical protein
MERVRGERRRYTGNQNRSEVLLLLSCVETVGLIVKSVGAIPDESRGSDRECISPWMKRNQPTQHGTGS